jgi:glycosyltransferase involved in cell wall biosynthesis
MPPPRVRRHYHVHFDLVDNFHDEWPENFVGRSRRAFLRQAMSNADTLSACSHSLCDRVRELTGREPAYAPNGAPVDRFARFSQADGLALRGKLGLDGKFVIGFIGNHGADFDGMATLLDAFVMARASRADLALLIVGPDSDKLAKARGLGRDQGVWIIGPVAPDDVPPYFLACDAGVHPYDLRPLTHDATPLNVIEFSACAKPVLCNPLREMQRLALPNVRFTRDGSAPAWTEAFLDPARFAPFDSNALARAIEPFQWSHSADVIRAEMGL